MRVLFFNEGNLGSHVMGQGQVDAVLREHVATAPGVEARFAGLTPMGRLARAAAQRTTPRLERSGLDFRTARWHVVQSLRARAALRHELADRPADVVHVHSQSVSFALGRLMRRTPVALSVDVTVGDWFAMPAWRPDRRTAALEIAPSRRMERRAFERAAVVLAWTAWTRRAVEQAAPRARVVEHHPGIDLRRWAPAPRRPRERPRVLFVGGRFAEKGGEDLLAALGDALGRDVELDLVTPADVAERPGVRVHRLGPGDPQLLDLQQQADVFCLPTHGDAVPWAVLEAMACGTPVVASPVGGIPDLLGGGEAGVLAPFGDSRALGEALRALLADAPRREALAAAARQRCEERYDPAQQGRLLLELFAELTAERVGGR